MKPYETAQQAIVNLKSAIYQLLSDGPQTGLKNSEIGRMLGVYSGHIGHKGHISRTILALMEAEDVVEQDPVTKRWTLKGHIVEE